MYISKNEAEGFSYEDSIITGLQIEDDGIYLLVEALVVEPQNSQNTNFQRSYADTATITFAEGKVVNAVKEGFKRYDADDKLLEEIPDREMDRAQLDSLLAGLKGQYLYDLKAAGQENDTRNYVLGIEQATDDLTGVDADSYQILIQCRDMTVSWERYMNRKV